MPRPAAIAVKLQKHKSKIGNTLRESRAKYKAGLSHLRSDSIGKTKWAQLSADSLLFAQAKSIWTSDRRAGGHASLTINSNQLKACSPWGLCKRRSAQNLSSQAAKRKRSANVSACLETLYAGFPRLPLALSPHQKEIQCPRSDA